MMVIFSFVPVGAVSTQDQSDIIQRINYGVVFKQEAQLYLAKESWLHTFQVSLPRHFSLPNIDFCRNSSHDCNAFNGIVNFINHLQESTAVHLQESIKATCLTVNIVLVHCSHL